MPLINAGAKKVLNFRKPVDLFNFFLSKRCAWFNNSYDCAVGLTIHRR